MMQIEKAQKHLERAQQLFGTQFGTQFGTRPRTRKHKENKRPAKIRTVEDVHRLMDQKLSESTRRNIVIALLRNLKDDKMSNAIVNLLKHQCSRIKIEERCKSACKWSTPFLLSWLFSGSCSIDPKVNVIAAFGPKKSYVGAMFGIARVLQFLSTNTNNEGYQDQQISKMITSVCIEFAQSHETW